MTKDFYVHLDLETELTFTFNLNAEPSSYIEFSSHPRIHNTSTRLHVKRFPLQKCERTVRCNGHLWGGGLYTSPCGQTDACKNISFPQLLLQTVTTTGRGKLCNCCCTIVQDSNSAFLWFPQYVINQNLTPAEYSLTFPRPISKIR